MTDIYRSTNDFKKCYEPRTNIVKDERCGLVYRLPQYFAYVEEPLLSATDCACGQ